MTEWDGLDESYDLLTEATMEVVEAYHRRLEREAVAAWMAGYDALDVVKPQSATVPNSPEEWNATLSVRVAFIPRYDEGIDGYSPFVRVERLDLSELTPAAASGFRKAWRDDDAE